MFGFGPWSRERIARFLAKHPEVFSYLRDIGWRPPAAAPAPNFAEGPPPTSPH